jgi:hypothetical protein
MRPGEENKMENKTQRLYQTIKKIADEALKPHPDLGQPYIYSWVRNEEREARESLLSTYASDLESDERKCRRANSKRQLPFHRMAQRLLDDVTDMPEEYFSVNTFRARLNNLMKAFRAEDKKYRSPGFHGIATPPFLEDWVKALEGDRK